MALAAAIETDGPRPELVKNRLISSAFPGATGPTQFDKNRDVIGHRFEVKIIKDGKPVAYS